MAKKGAASTWVLAKRQTSGKGSRGRKWETGEGNFSASLLMILNEPPQNAALRSFSAALALADTFGTLGVNQKDISLKWPNDVLIKGQKVAGILLESSGTGASVDHLIVGIGINLAHAPPKEHLPSNALAPIALNSIIEKPVSPEQTLTVLAPAFQAYEMLFAQSGFDPIRTKWIQKAARLNETITVQQGDSSITGTFSDIDTSGALVLTTSKGVHLVSAGEIFFPTVT